jgi:signal transduction histidine kinase
VWQAIWKGPRRPRTGHPRETARLAVIAAALAALDTSLSLSDGPTTGWLGPHAGLMLQILADASLVLAGRRPKLVTGFVLAVAVLMAVSSSAAPGLLVAEHAVSPITVPRATPVVIIIAMLRLDRRYALVVTTLFAVLAGRLWAPSWSITPFGLLSTLGPALAALYFDARRQLMQSLRDRAERAEREQLLLAEKARSEERRRLAAEMHDVVTHRLSLIVLHAGALRLTSAEDAVQQAADEIRSSGTRAIEELRDLMGVLRSGANTAESLSAGSPTAPSPSPAVIDLDALVAESNSVGITTELTVEGKASQLAPVVARTAYRVVQEALTNVRKHARGSRVEVAVRYRPQDVTVEVVNTASTVAADPVLDGSGSGAGLTGLRQRVEVIGGSLEYGPTDSGGFRLGAILPAYVPTAESRQHDLSGDRR